MLGDTPINVYNHLDLPICYHCPTAIIDVDHEIIYTFGDCVKTIDIIITCDHHRACERAYCEQVEAMQDDRR